MEALMAMEGVGTVCPDSAALIRETNVGNVQIIAKFGTTEELKESIFRRSVGANRLSPSR